MPVVSAIGLVMRPPRGAVIAAALAAAALGAPAAAAQAQLPQLAIASPAQDSAIADATPLFGGPIEGMSGEELQLVAPVTVVVHQGTTTAGAEVARLESGWFPGPTWEAGPAAALADGWYTAQALSLPEEQPAEALASQPVTFRVDTVAPAPTIASPAPGTTIGAGTLAVSGEAGTAEGDLPAVTVQVYAGGAAEGTPLEAVEVPAAAGAWSAALGALAQGSYTLRAEQRDTAGNLGASAPVTFAVGPPSPPHAAFQWFPAVPQVGEPVTLISSSTDLDSPITSYAWGTGASGALAPGGAALTTTFTTAGPHVMRLVVTDAAGAVAQATETIAVHHKAATPLQPFPIVRIAGRETGSGVRLTVLTVDAPVTATVTVRIRGAGGRATSVSRVATAARGGRSTVLLSFPRFARAIPAGSILEVRVSKAEHIGKLTRLIPHRGRLPTRQDLCLSPGGSPMRCPAS
jgi:large repetitive protein